MGRGRKKIIRAALVVTVVALGATGAIAQNVNSPVSGSFTFISSADYNSNPGLSAISSGATFDFSETLSFSIRSETSSQLLEFVGDTGLTFSQTVGGGSSLGFNTPTATLHYFRESANSNLDLSGSFWTGDVINSFDADPTSAVSLIVDAGTLSTVSGSLVYNWGVNAPLGFSLNSSYNMRDYEGISDPGLFDETTARIGVNAKLRISPATQGTLSVNYTDYVAGDAISTSSQTMNYSFNLTHELASALTLNANVGYIDKSTTTGGITRVTTGFVGGAGVTQLLPDGSLFGDISFDASGATTSTALTFGRSLDLPDGSVSARLTADMKPGNKTQFLGSATYTKQLPDGSFRLNLSQSLSTDNLGQDIKFSNLGVVFQKTLNSDAAINLSLDLSRSEDGGAGSAATLSRATLSASYSRSITSDWDLSVGYQHRQNSGSAIATADSDSLFLTLTRDLQFGF